MLLLDRRWWIRRRLPRSLEGSAQFHARDRRRHQNPQAWIEWKVQVWLPNWSVYHGPVRPSERDIPSRRRYAVQSRDDHHRVHGERQSRHFLACQRRKVLNNSTHRNVARYCSWNVIPQRHELRPPRSSSSQCSGECVAHLQDCRLRVVARDWERKRCLHDAWRQDSCPMDSTRSNSVPKVHISIRRVVVRGCVMGGDVVWWAPILELVESRCDQEHREGISIASTDGLPRGSLSANARLLAEAANTSSNFLQHNADARQSGTSTTAFIGAQKLADNRSRSRHVSSHANIVILVKQSPATADNDESYDGQPMWDDGRNDNSRFQHYRSMALWYQNGAICATLQGFRVNDCSTGKLSKFPRNEIENYLQLNF